jgi:arylformamidase
MKGKYTLFSYPLSSRTPMYGLGKAPELSPKKSIARGDSCNTFELTLLNHSGTHIDAPNHFWRSGKRLSGYTQDELVFSKPAVVSCPKSAAGLIGIGDLRGPLKGKKFDLLLIRTGFQKYRSSNPRKYSTSNPCLSPEAAEWLRSEHPEVKAVGVDCISIASCACRDLGRKTHRILLGSGRGKPVLIIEDMRVPKSAAGLRKVIVSPLFVEGIDSSPCSVIGVYNA